MDTPIGWSENVCPERRLVVLGRTGSGKSTTCNNILGRDEFKSDTCGQSVTNKCQRAICQRFGRNVEIIDTPGLFDTGMSNADITREVVKCIGMTAPGPHAFVMVVRIDRFTKEEQDTVEHFKNVFGKGMMKYLMILFTRKDDLDYCGKTIEKYLENVPQMLRDLLKSCGNRYIAFNNRASPEERNETVQRFLDMVDRIHSNNSGEVYTSDMYKEAEKVMLKREEQLRQEHEAEVNKEKRKIEEEYQTKMTAMEEAQTEKIAQLVQQLSIKEQQKEQQLEMEKLKLEIEKQRLHMESDLQKERQRLELEAERRKMLCEANPPNYRETAKKEVSNEEVMVMNLIKGVVKLVGPQLLVIALDKMGEHFASKLSIAPATNECDKAESSVDEEQVTDKTNRKEEAK
ncbi:GTPase IMAP family member 9-like isoform X2 [Haliotis rubra]|nr:GTPase IMAP family member 9-like isoform X2 [Haliotis rubra]XP_046563334.1 GTPase IMAP family member 9-like isoform X2 [Haliotis rubra]